MFNPLSLSDLLRETGYEMQLVKCHGFLPSQLSTRKPIRVLDEMLANTPFVRLIGGNFILSARKCTL
jgi:hypothetical protein